MDEIFNLIVKAKAVRYVTNADFREQTTSYIGLDFNDNLIADTIKGRNIVLEIGLMMDDNATMIDIKIDSPNIVIGQALLLALSTKQQY